MLADKKGKFINNKGLTQYLFINKDIIFSIYLIYMRNSKKIFRNKTKKKLKIKRTRRRNKSLKGGAGAVDSAGDKIILIAGGSYAPPHIGHLNVWKLAATEVKKNFPDKNIELMIIPVGDYYQKKSTKIFPYGIRVKLINKLIESSNEKGITYSVGPNINEHKQLDTIGEINEIEKLTGIKPFVVFGSDNLLGALDQSPSGWNLNDEELNLLLENNTFVILCSDDANDPRGSCENVRREFDKKIKEKGILSRLFTCVRDVKESSISSSDIIGCIERLNHNLSYLSADEKVEIFNMIDSLPK